MIMAFPQIQVCIVCEAIRQEEGGKLSILGFYGVLPGLELAAGRIPASLTVLFVLGPTKGGTWEISSAIQNQKGPATESQEGKVSLPPMRRDTGSFVSVTFGAVDLIEQGTYTFTLMVDGELAYEQRFLVLPQLDESATDTELPRSI